MTKVTPEFKRAFKHFIDGTCYGRRDWIDDTEVAQLWVDIGGHVGGKSIAFSAISDDLQYYFEWREGYTSGLEIAYKLLQPAPNVATAFMERVKNDVRDRIWSSLEGLPLFDLDPLAELVDVDADKWARMFADGYAKYAADYRNRIKTAILTQLRETPDNDAAAIQRLTHWGVKACAYWYAMEAERSGHDAWTAYRDVYAAGTLRLSRHMATLPDTVGGAMAVFCAAYSHGIDPCTGRRIALDVGKRDA